MLKKVLFGVLALILLALPLAFRWLYLYEGRYEPGEVARPDLGEIEAATPEIEPFEDRYTAAEPGIILVDRAHSNRFEMAELSVLQARLAARGQRLEAVETPDNLAKQLRQAQALIVISPGENWRANEIELVRTFVEKGGRLLLVADPTRFTIELDEQDFAILDADTPHINDLAAQFGLLFQADYLYNTSDNAGNFRNIKLTDFAEHELTQGLEQVAFYAAHSITSEEPALVSAGGETRSSTSARADKLTVALLTAQEAVLALGDLTFMTDPYSAAYDNARLIANIADFLSNVRRDYELLDFPFFFDEQVDLVFAGDPLLDSDLLQAGSALQSLLTREGRDLVIREAENEDLDTLFFGLYEEADDVEPYLATAQVSLLITPTATTDEGEGKPKAQVTLSPIPTQPVTVTGGTTSTPEPAGASSAPAVVATSEISPALQNRVQIESLGETVSTGTALLLLQSDGERQVMIVLADTEKGLENALQRLAQGSLEGCLLRETQAPTPTSLALCPTGEIAQGDGDGGWQEPGPPTTAPSMTATPAPITGTVEPTVAVGRSLKSILILSLDEGTGRYDGLTSAELYAAILKGRYETTTWSKAHDAPLDTEALFEHDLVIWTGGDYPDAFGELENELFLRVMLEGIPAILSGAYVGEVDTGSAQHDIQVKDAAHPMVEGFKSGEVIGFVPPPSGSIYEIGLLEDMGGAEGAVVFVRGPNSDKAGAPSVLAMEDQDAGIHVALIGFPLYLLPEEARTRLVLNTVDWMLPLQ